MGFAYICEQRLCLCNTISFTDVISVELNISYSAECPVPESLDVICLIYVTSLVLPEDLYDFRSDLLTIMHTSLAQFDRRMRRTA